MTITWSRNHFKKITTGAILAFIFTVLLVILLYGTSKKLVILSIDGEEKMIETTQWSVQNILEEQTIVLSEYDEISISLDEGIRHGDTIFIQKAKPVKLTVDGQSIIVHTTNGTVGDVLREQKVSLGREDRVAPSVMTRITGPIDIKVTRVMTVLEHEAESIPFETIEKKDAKLLQGKQEIVQAGQLGLRVKTLEKVYEDGQLVTQSLLAENIKSEKLDEIVAIGTREPVRVLSASSPTIQEVTKQGVTFGIKRELEGVKLTAYDAGYNSTGKTKEHPQYGITYSGTKVAVGRTVAVDPKVIPLGWWIYIEDYGFRRAEDIGSGVKGNHVDIFVEDEKEANRFGLKRGHKVYVIGPNNPIQ